MNSMVHSAKNWRFLPILGAFLMVLSLLLVACGSTQTRSPTPVPNKPGTTVYTYKGHTDIVPAVAWSPDGKYIVSSGWDLTYQVWEVMTGKRIHTIPGMYVATWSPDGKYLATGSQYEGDNNVHVWNTTTWSTVLNYTGNSKGAAAVAWSPDGKYIASGGNDNTVQVWIAP